MWPKQYADSRSQNIRSIFPRREKSRQVIGGSCLILRYYNMAICIYIHPGDDMRWAEVKVIILAGSYEPVKR